MSSMDGMNVNANEFIPNELNMVQMYGMRVSARLLISLCDENNVMESDEYKEMFDELERKFVEKNKWIFE